MNKTLMFLSAASLAFVATACAEKAEDTVTTTVTPDLNDDGTVATTEVTTVAPE